MHINLKLLEWRRERMKNPTYDELAVITGVSSTTLSDLFRGQIDPKASTINAIFIGMGLNPKYAFDLDLKTESQFRRAVVAR